GLQEFAPARHTISRDYTAAIGASIFHTQIVNPGTQCLVGIRIGSLPALNKVGGIENSLKMRIVACLQELDTANDGIAVDALLVLVEQCNASSTRFCRHL